jgi:hypothetical protein
MPGTMRWLPQTLNPLHTKKTIEILIRVPTRTLSDMQRPNGSAFGGGGMSV